MECQPRLSNNIQSNEELREDLVHPQSPVVLGHFNYCSNFSLNYRHNNHKALQISFLHEICAGGTKKILMLFKSVVITVNLPISNTLNNATTRRNLALGLKCSLTNYQPTKVNTFPLIRQQKRYKRAA